MLKKNISYFILPYYNQKKVGRAANQAKIQKKKGVWADTQWVGESVSSG